MKVTVRVKGGKQVYQSLQKIGESVDTIVNDEIETQMKAAAKALSKPGKPIKYPVKWDSEKQRRAFFATDGFGKGIPYKRTGRYSQSFRVVKTGRGTNRRYSLINTWPKSKYVGGDARGKQQSRIHFGRWPIVSDVVRKYAKRLASDVKKPAVSKIRQLLQKMGFGL